jgi:uncharacterized phage protein gp47/JayE
LIPITISGATETDYNVANAEITVTGTHTFTYTVAATPSTPATGSPTLSGQYVVMDMESVDFTDEADADGLESFQIEAPIVGAAETVQSTYEGFSGGLLQETDDALKVRYLDRIQNPIAHFNVAEITAKAKTVAGVTRVFVQEITPAPGQVTVYFMRDLDEAGPIPSAAQVNATKAVLNEIRPANTDEEDLIVLAPTAVPTNFVFTSLLPATTTMSAAVLRSLQELFDERVSIGTNVTEDQYRSAIFNTVDTDTGEIVESFTLSTPIGSIAVADGEIATLGTVTGL